MGTTGLIKDPIFSKVMGITREGRHKRRHTGGRREKYRKKRKFELGRPAAMTKIGEKNIHTVRCRGGYQVPCITPGLWKFFLGYGSLHTQSSYLRCCVQCLEQ